MTCFLPRSKGDRQNEGRSFNVPALSRCCPVAATGDWIALAALTEGPLFRRIDRWAGIHTEPLHANSLIRLLRRAFAQAGLPSPDDYSGHSLRRGFRSEEHTSELQSLMRISYAVFCLKKKTNL